MYQIFHLQDTRAINTLYIECKLIVRNGIVNVTGLS